MALARAAFAARSSSDIEYHPTLCNVMELASLVCCVHVVQIRRHTFSKWFCILYCLFFIFYFFSFLNSL